jgi:hypothetical protein
MDNNCSNNNGEFKSTKHLVSPICEKAVEDMTNSITHYDFYNMYKYAAVDNSNNTCPNIKSLWR